MTCSGAVLAKVRHGLVHVTLDVPDDAGLLAWGTTAHKPLAGHVTFFETGGRTARKTLAWEAGECGTRTEALSNSDRPHPKPTIIAAPAFVMIKMPVYQLAGFIPAVGCTTTS